MKNLHFTGRLRSKVVNPGHSFAVDITFKTDLISTGNDQEDFNILSIHTSDSDFAGSGNNSSSTNVKLHAEFFGTMFKSVAYSMKDFYNKAVKLNLNLVAVDSNGTGSTNIYTEDSDSGSFSYEHS